MITSDPDASRRARKRIRCVDDPAVAAGPGFERRNRNERRYYCFLGGRFVIPMSVVRTVLAEA